MIAQRADWMFAAMVSLAVHAGVVALYWAQPQTVQTASRAGSMTIIDGGLVNSVATVGANAVTPSTQAAAPVSEVAPAAVASVRAVEAVVPERRAAQTAKPVPPAQARPERKPAERQQARPRKSAPASSRSDTAGSRSQSNSRAAQAGSGGRSSGSDGRAAESSYASRVVARIQRAKRYPRDGRGDQGTARVRFTISSSGRVTAASIVRSSGSRALDRAALDLVRRAGPYPRFPAAIGKSSLTYTVPLSYRGR